MPGRSASTASARSASGSAGRTARRCRADRRGAAAPILFDAFARLPGLPAALPKAPKGAIFAANNRLPLPLQRFRPASRRRRADAAPRIMFPPNGARLELGETVRDGLKISGGVQPLTLLVNGVPRPRTSRRTLFFTPDGPGFARLTVMDARGVADSVVVRIE
jgi:penicillin-binding protein 1C